MWILQSDDGHYFQYQSSLNVTAGSPLNGITIVGLSSNATQIFAQKGSIHVLQLKYGFCTGANVRFPIAVTYSNRTELIAHAARISAPTNPPANASTPVTSRASTIDSF